MARDNTETERSTKGYKDLKISSNSIKDCSTEASGSLSARTGMVTEFGSLRLKKEIDGNSLEFKAKANKTKSTMFKMHKAQSTQIEMLSEDKDLQATPSSRNQMIDAFVSGVDKAIDATYKTINSSTEPHTTKLINKSIQVEHTSANKSTNIGEFDLENTVCQDEAAVIPKSVSVSS